jgi:hypothetical protein
LNPRGRRGFFLLTVGRRHQALPSRSKIAYFDRMGRLNTVLSTRKQSGFWRVRIAWPNGSINYFGRFVSEAEAKEWIIRHDWMTHSAINEGDIRRKRERA